MKTKIIFLSILFAFSIFQLTDAQVGNYLKNKAANAAWRAGSQADKQVDKKINEKVDEGVANAFEKNSKDGDKADSTAAAESSGPSQSSKSSSSKSSSGNSANDAMSRAMMGKLGISMERPANIKDKYDYSGNMKMTVQSWDEKGKSDGEVLYTTHYTSDNKGYAMDFESKEKGESRIIFDYENLMMLILSDDGKDKTGMVMSAAPGAVSSVDSATAAASTGTEVTDYNDYYSKFKKSGRSKNVSGYNCDEYVYEDEEIKGSYWITNDLSANLWANMFNANTIATVYAGRPNGFIMEWVNEQKASKEKSQMIVKEVNKNQPASFSTVGYTFMSFKAQEKKPQEKK